MGVTRFPKNIWSGGIVTVQNPTDLRCFWGPDGPETRMGIGERRRGRRLGRAVERVHLKFMDQEFCCLYPQQEPEPEPGQRGNNLFLHENQILVLEQNLREKADFHRNELKVRTRQKARSEPFTTERNGARTGGWRTGGSFLTERLAAAEEEEEEEEEGA
ncbi:hypothetical protein FQA47_002563 [Oryzias melastigma]|uniref:Uncharacterized protein n=1 Tax=Oryzias melastigma TaxID=30732 RepID=A0A834C6C8_ORYME|nr:hypothetical protein FQA47_002563 [Oryzias melastigma]